MKRKTERDSNLCGPMGNTKIGLNRAMPQYHSQYCNTFGNIKNLIRCIRHKPITVANMPASTGKCNEENTQQKTYPQL